MANDNGSMKFDHRELAVIFSLFTFVALLMFTVGILVGKGLTQAKLNNSHTKASTEHSEEEHPSSTHSSNPNIPHEATAESEAQTSPPKQVENHPNTEHDDESHTSIQPESLKLVPKSEDSLPPVTEEQLFPEKIGQAEAILKNPKIRKLVDDSPPPYDRHSESFAPLSPLKSRQPASFGSNRGKYSVQVGAYLSKQDAEERVTALKNLGFPYAYFSVKEQGEPKEKWFRVWLGYFPNLESASQSGKYLQSRGEVRNYLVRRPDPKP